MKKRKSILLRFCILSLCIFGGFMVSSQTARADLILDNQQIDGAHAIFFDQQPLREIQYNGTVVWRAGANITYAIDSSVSEIHFVPYGQTTLAVTCNKAGYEFVGWRTDKTASGDILAADLCTGDEKTLYAVFRKAVTLSYYNGSATKQTSVGYIYYNNGNVSNPEFTVSQTPLSGWTARGWSAGQTANAEIFCDALDHSVFTSDVTLYGVYQRTITASFDGNGAASGSVVALTGTAYYNSAGNTMNPSFTMPGNGFAKSGYAWAGWLQGSTGITRLAGENITLSADTIFTAQWQEAVQDFSYTGNVQSWTVPATGYYQLEVWGASGGNAIRSGGDGMVKAYGGTGGYSVGYVYLSKGDTLYICVGGKGSDADGYHGYMDEDYNWVEEDPENLIKPGGYNGGQSIGGGRGNYAGFYAYGGAGGGATHIAVTDRGVLSNYDAHRLEVLLVAGGGSGGMSEWWDCGMEDGDDDCHKCLIYDVYLRGGDGGGQSGASLSTYQHLAYHEDVTLGGGIPGTQNSGGGSFGTAPATLAKAGYPGGGGGWYGGSRAGGSGYIGGTLASLTYNGYSYISTTATSSHTGDGAAKITYLGH